MGLIATNGVEFTRSTSKFTNSTENLISGLKYVVALPAGVEILSAKDQDDNSLTVNVNTITSLSIPANDFIRLHITYHITDEDVVSCPVQIFGQLQNSEDCMVSGTELESFSFDCFSCVDIGNCASLNDTYVVEAGTGGISVTSEGVENPDGSSTTTFTVSATETISITNVQSSGGHKIFDFNSSAGVTAVHETVTDLNWAAGTNTLTFEDEAGISNDVILTGVVNLTTTHDHTAPAGVPNGMIFISSINDALYYKNSSGTVFTIDVTPV